MEKGTVTPALAVLIGAAVGLAAGCLITWFPIRLLFCAVYNTPDCEEIVLITFPFYCLLMPLLGAGIAYWLYRRRRGPE